MKKIVIVTAGLSCLCLLVFAASLAAFESEASGRPDDSRAVVIQGDDQYVGDFAGFVDGKIQINLARTGYRVSLPLADDVEFLHKDSGYRPYDPADIPSEAPVKAIEVDREIVQVILLWILPR